MRRVLAFLFCLLAAPSWALSPAQEIILLGGSGQSYYASPAATGKLPPWLSYASAGVRYYFDASGNLQTAPNNQVNNSTLAGASPGSPGLPPTGWVISTGSGVSYSVTNVAVINGMQVFDVAFSGTTTAAVAFGINIGTLTDVNASYGQTWIASFSAQLVSGALGSVAASVVINEYDASNAYLTSGAAAAVLTGSLAQYTYTRTLSGGTTAHILPQLSLVAPSSGIVVNFTVRLTMPGLSLVTAAQTTPNPFMPTSGSAYFGPVVNDHNPSTLAALGLRSEPQRTNLYLNNTVPATQTITVANATQYTVSFYGTGTLTLAGAATQTMTGSAGVRTSYTFTSASTSLVATDVTSSLTATSYPQVEAGAFATSPILTYGSSVTVPADNWSFTGAALALLSSPVSCHAVEFTPEGVNPIYNPIIKSPTTGAFGSTFTSTVSQAALTNISVVVANSIVPTAGAKSRIAALGKAGNYAIATNNTLAIGSYATAPTAGAAYYLGKDGVGDYGSMWFSQILIKPSCTATQVKAYSTANSNMSH